MEVGMVFQSFNLFPHKTVLQNLTLAPSKLKHLSRNDAESMALGLLEKVGIQEEAGAYPSQLSGGQQQRVAIARAMLSQPSVMFADEPTGNLDSRSSGEILELLRRSAEDYGQTTVMVTHDAHAATIADRLVFLADGRIVRTQGRSTATEVLDALSEVTR
jgi:ABC-type polar amino acid transport system ATPase subunit